MSGTRPPLRVPPGVQCFVGDEVRRRRAIEQRVLRVFEGWDYEEIVPPLFDYADAFSDEALRPKTYSFVGRDGALLALRPDFTSLLAKLAAGRLAGRPTPIRLYYSGEVLRYEPPKAGRQSELYQMGLERLGGDARTADVEVLAIAAESLEAAGARDVILALGHVGVFGGLLAGGGLEPARVEELRDRVEAKDAASVRDLLRGSGLPAPFAEALEGLTALAGDASVLADAESRLACCAPALRALGELRTATEALAAGGLGSRLALDLSEVSGLDYYTGLVFRAYAPGLGFEVGGGGRYDTLLARFGRPLPAVGFMIGLDRLALLLAEQGAPAPAAPQAALVPAEADLAAALRAARAERARGGRVRFGNGGAR